MEDSTIQQLPATWYSAIDACSPILTCWEFLAFCELSGRYLPCIAFVAMNTQP